MTIIMNLKKQQIKGIRDCSISFLENMETRL